MQKERIIAIADLRYVSIQCPQCRTRVVLDMKERSAFSEKHGVFAPPECPACHSPYDSAVRPNVDQMQRAYQALVNIADWITFRSEPEPEK